MTSPPHECEDMSRVDADERAHRPTEDDEEEVLKDLYGPPDQYGIYKGVPS